MPRITHSNLQQNKDLQTSKLKVINIKILVETIIFSSSIRPETNLLNIFHNANFNTRTKFLLSLKIIKSIRIVTTGWRKSKICTFSITSNTVRVFFLATAFLLFFLFIPLFASFCRATRGSGERWEVHWLSVGKKLLVSDIFDVWISGEELTVFI